VIAALVGALLVLAVGYIRVIVRSADEDSPGRHRLSPLHPGFESAPEELAALLRARRAG
jgi:hypothetical protein